MENIGKFQQNHSKISDYVHHVLDEDISNEQLNDLFRYYNNYGVCNRAIIQAKNQTGDQILHVINILLNKKKLICFIIN